MKKSVQCNITFIFDALSENIIFLVKIKYIVDLRKTFCFFFRKRGSLGVHNCAEILHATNVYYAV